MIPRATMRLQLHKGFTFADASAVVPYLVDLGISHVYSSPILTARAGSIHGYDVIDPTSINMELGGETGFRNFVYTLKRAGLGIIVDIVPNHMAVGNADNPWWTDVLRHGRSSYYADFFDIDWDSSDPDLRGKIVAPFLGRPYGEALESGEIRLTLSAGGDPVIRYFNSEFPIDPEHYAHITEYGIESFSPNNTNGRAQLHTLLEQQHYRLAWWRVAGDEINWRRFFDINGLAGLRIEVPRVFEETHATLFRLYAEGLVDGFRVDHVDGLSDPPGYCRRLRQRLDELAPGRCAYLIIEKILGVGETLATDWGVDGTSGYDFMNEVNAVQHDTSSVEALAEIWNALTQRSPYFEDEEVAARRETLCLSFHAQLEALISALHRVARADTTTRDLSRHCIGKGVVALLSHFPVYRGYDAGATRSPVDQVAFAKAMVGARSSSPESMHPILNHLDRWLGGESGNKVAATRFQQLSAPIAAKSVEDTAFYRYGRLLSRNDVGFDASRLGCSIADFHAVCKERFARFPNAMLATATHDHKRGEDLRARLAVISEIPEQWGEFLRQCRAIEIERPAPADELMLYQMIVGAWPLDLDPSDEVGCREFEERLARWQQKALREAKLHTSWTAPNEDYEKRATKFLTNILRSDSPFRPMILAFIDSIASAGALNGLTQVLLKLTVPGMPDFFQGTEFWDFSLVDPDNRRDIDYHLRQDALAQHVLPSQVQISWRDGRVKQALVRALLELRRQMPSLFASGQYIPIPITGPLRDHFIAFGRSTGERVMLVTVPRLMHQILSGDGRISLDPNQLLNTILRIPEPLRGHDLRPLLSPGEPIRLQEGLPIEVLLNGFPLSVLSPAD